MLGISAKSTGLADTPLHSPWPRMSLQPVFLVSQHQLGLQREAACRAEPPCFGRPSSWRGTLGPRTVPPAPWSGSFLLSFPSSTASWPRACSLGPSDLFENLCMSDLSSSSSGKQAVLEQNSFANQSRFREVGGLDTEPTLLWSSPCENVWVWIKNKKTVYFPCPLQEGQDKVLFRSTSSFSKVKTSV